MQSKINLGELCALARFLKKGDRLLFAMIFSFQFYSQLKVAYPLLSSRRKRTRNGNTIELDLLSIGNENGKKMAVVIEVKTYLRVTEIKEFLKDLKKFYDFFEEYRNLSLIGGMAFMNPSKGAMEYAQRQGLYLFSLGEDTLTLANSFGFKPKVWKFNKVSTNEHK